MLKRTVSGIMLITLLISILTLGFVVQLARSEPRTWTVNGDAPIGFPTAQEALNAVNPADTKLDSIEHEFVQAIKSNLRTRLVTQFMDVFRQLSAANCRCDFEDKVERDDFAYIDDDSAEFIIGLVNPKQKNYDKLKNIITSKGGMVVNNISAKDGIRAIVVDIPFQAITSLVTEARAASLLNYVEPNYKFQPALVPNDPYWHEQWGPRKIEADVAWNITTGDPTVLVAVIDTGIDYNHPDLIANYVPLGYDWVNNDMDPMDDKGHGTHCAGIIAAGLNNGIGIAGLAQVQVMAEKCGGTTGKWAEDDLVNGIYHAVDQGADILSCSWGDYRDSETMHEAVKYAYDAGVLVVAAAGNEATSDRLYTAAYDEVVAVTATDEFDDSWEKTNFGDWVEVAAPGVNIYSTISEIHDPQVDYPYDSVSGTSMSTPHVAGVAALIWSRFPNMTRDQVRAQLRYTTDDLGYPGFDIYTGYGRVNARKAVERAPMDHDLLISHLETPPYVKLGNRVIINTTVFNFGTSKESDIKVQFAVNGKVINSTNVSFLSSMKSTTVSFNWCPTAEGTYNVTSNLVSVPGETVTENNALSVFVPVRTATVFRVPEDWPTIQAAVNATISGIGDTIRVAAGVYYEHLTISKSVTVVGEDRISTVIDGNGTGTVVYITTHTITSSRIRTVGGVNFSNFTVRNGSRGSGIHVHKSSGANISENVILNNRKGIELSKSYSCTLHDNNMIGNRENFLVSGDLLSHFMHEIDISNTVDGKPVYYWVNEHNREVPADAGYVAVVNSTDILVKNLNLTNNGHGVLFAYTVDSTIVNLNASNNYFGIFLHESRGNIISGNVISENGFGVLLNSRSDSNIVSNNKVSKSSWVGICLVDSSDNTISGNTLSDNQFGVWLDSSNNNTIYHNDFNNNPTQAYLTMSFNNRWDNGYPSGGNYWSDYDGTDSDGDGIGDTPYTIDENNQDYYPLIIPYTRIGDLDNDGAINVLDLCIFGKAYGSYQGHPRWNSNADLDNNGVINILDGVQIAKNFGRTM